jgi:predicted nucleic acid-binding protein
VSQFAKSVIVDSGALLALLAERDEHHRWATEQWKFIEPPIQICEAVISETSFLLKREDCDTDPLFAFLENVVFRIGFAAREHLSDIRALMHRYRNLPISFADACMVRMAELSPTAAIFTVDRDFVIYRKHGNRVISTLMPPHD